MRELREALLNKKETGFNDLKIFLHSQVAKDAKIEKRLLSSLKSVTLRKQIKKRLTIQPFAETSKSSGSESIQLRKGSFKNIKDSILCLTHSLNKP